MIKYNLYIGLILIGLTMLVSCKAKVTETSEQVSDQISISKAQFTSEKMVLGTIKQMEVDDVVECTGMVVAKADGKASVGLMVGGVVDRIYVNSGEYVKKGQRLISIGGNDILDLQRDIAESWAKMEQLSVDYKRISTLYDKEIQSQKEYVSIKSAYRSELARLSALKLKIAGLHLDTIQVKRGEFISSYPLLAPISGNISQLLVSLGEHVAPEDPIIEIVNPQKLQLKLSVFENDIASVAKGQKVKLYSSESDELYGSATISQISSALNQTNKAIDCYAELDGIEEGHFMNNQFLRAEIITASDTVKVLPNTAILNDNNQALILELVDEGENDYFFTQKEIKTGRSNGDYIEVIGDTNGGKVLLNGVYNIQL